MPQPMNMTASRFGNGDAPDVAAPNAGSDSRSGRAMATPAPRRMERREIVRSKLRGILFGGISLLDISLTLLRLGFAAPLILRDLSLSLIEELRAGYDRLDQ